MSHNLRRPLAIAAALSALFLALPAPSQAVILWDWQPAVLTLRVLSWLDDLGLVARSAARPHARYEKEGSMVEPNGQPRSSTPPASPTSDEGSMLEPNG